MGDSMILVAQSGVPLPTRPLRLGLTGGIGSGKSTVAQLLMKFWPEDAMLIDADAISRSSTAAGGAAMPLIAQQFGADMVDATGALNRALMRDRVFKDAKAKQQLEAIIHPLVAQAIAAQYDHALAQQHSLCVFDIPLLVESGARWRGQLDLVLVVDCEPATQMERVQRRDGLSPDAIQRVIAHQASRSQRLVAADLVLVNEGQDLQALGEKIRSLILCLQSRRLGINPGKKDQILS
jgi:dephospho-CoA kinase